jgi:hypothetical protein
LVSKIESRIPSISCYFENNFYFSKYLIDEILSTGQELQQTNATDFYVDRPTLAVFEIENMLLQVMKEGMLALDEHAKKRFEFKLEREWIVNAQVCDDWILLFLVSLFLTT